VQDGSSKFAYKILSTYEASHVSATTKKLWVSLSHQMF